MCIDLEGSLYDSLGKFLKSLQQKERQVSSQLASLQIIRGWVEQKGLSLEDAIGEVVKAAIDAIEVNNPDAAQLLRNRYFRNNSPSEISRKMHVSIETFYRRQREAIRQLDAEIAKRECAQREMIASKRELNLPDPPYDRLFGTEEIEKDLYRLLLNESSPSVIAILGMGGIGKTSAAYAVCKRVLREPRFEHVVWVEHEPPTLSGRSLTVDAAFTKVMQTLANLPHIGAKGLAPEQRNNRVRFVLNQIPHLVIVDNIEEKEVAAHLYKTLPAFAEPSRFLITSRAQVPGNLPVYGYRLPELSQTHSLELLRHVARQSNLPSLASADDAALRKIYETVGGNPLALRLAVGMLLSFPYDTVLRSLKEGKLRAQKLYDRIYRDLWDNLSQAHQQILQALLLNPAGITGEQLRMMTAIEDEMEFWSLMGDLIARSLIEIRGPFDQRRYQLHQLTISYIYSIVSGQPPSNEENFSQQS